MSAAIHTVTGAFGYSGRYIARRLLDRGARVQTLTDSLHRDNPFGGAVSAHPFCFERPALLRQALRGTRVLYNTYWVRFNHGGFSHALAVENTKKLFAAAKAAGVERIVHTSITNPSLDSPLEYFAGKAALEQALVATGLSYAILRPAVLFGGQDILINNIAWFLRRFAVFGLFGRGRYRLQPIHVDDFARLAVEQGALRDNVTIDATGPETFRYRDLVRTVGRIIGKRRPLVPLPPLAGYAVGVLVSRAKHDVTITRQEIQGLMDDLLYTRSPPVGETRLTAWARRHRDTLGLRYANELRRRVDRSRSYEQLQRG